MSGTVQITDPVGLFGQAPTQPQVIFEIPAGSAVTAKQLVALVMASDGVLTCVPATTASHDPAVKVGVALDAGATNDIIRVVVYGVAEVNTPATGPAISEVLILTATAGEADGAVADATTVAGDIHGVFLTDEIGTGNTCWAFITG